jgi:hypothetical protein
MALEDEVMEQEDSLGDEEETDLEIMVSMAEDMIDEAGSQVIEQALNSKDPGVIIGQFIMQLGSQLAEQLPFDISPRVMLARGGWVEQISDYLQEEYDVPQKIMDRAEIFVGSSAQNMAQGAQQQAAPEQMPAEQAAPAMPMEGMV